MNWSVISEDELRADFEAILDRCEAGEHFLIHRGDKPAVALIPLSTYATCIEKGVPEPPPAS